VAVTEAGAEAGDGEEAAPHAAATPRPMTSFSARSTTRPLGQPMVWTSSTVPHASAAAAAGTLDAAACRRQTDNREWCRRVNKIQHERCRHTSVAYKRCGANLLKYLLQLAQ
jgi:hypothetical protein